MAAKRKSKKFNFKLPKLWGLAPLCVGIVIGIASQRIPDLRTYTDEVIEPIEHQISSTHHHVNKSVVKGAPISSFHIDRSGYSLAYDARNRNPIWVYEHLTTIEKVEKLAGFLLNH